VYWGGQVTQDNAQNSGQMRGNFQVAIAGSNGYVTTQISTPAGYQNGVPFGKFAVNAPYDAQGYNTYMGAKIFTGIWDVSQCSNFCDAQTKYNLATAPKDGTPAKVCKFFNTYLLQAKLANGTIVPQGQYCSLYTEAWPIKYAVNGGQWRGQDQYTVDYSFGYAKTDAGVDPTVGDTTGAAYQARQDMTYYSSQLTSTFLPYCSSLLGYTPLVATTTPTSTFIPLTTATTVITVTALAKRDDATFTPGLLPVPLSLLSASAAASNQKRALATPAVLSKYPLQVQSSACGLIATQATSTSTTTAAAATTTLATQTVIASTTVTVAAAASSGVLQVQDSSSPYNGYYVTYKAKYANQGSATVVLLVNDRTSATTFIIDSQTGGFFSPDRSLEAVQNVYNSGNSAGIDGFFFGGVNIGSAYPAPKCQVTNGKLACVGGSPNDARNSLQICPSNSNPYSAQYGVGPWLILSTAGRTGCTPAGLVFTT
jgi:hypothetical protein